MEEKSGIVLENPSVDMNRLQAKIWMRRALPVRRAQMEMRNMLLKLKERGYIVRKMVFMRQTLGMQL